MLMKLSQHFDNAFHVCNPDSLIQHEPVGTWTCVHYLGTVHGLYTYSIYTMGKLLSRLTLRSYYKFKNKIPLITTEQCIFDKDLSVVVFFFLKKARKTIPLCMCACMCLCMH